MNRLLSFLTGRHSIVLLVVTLLSLDAVLIVASFLPPVMSFLIDSNLFQIIVATTLLEILLLLAVRVLQETPLALLEDGAAKGKIRELIDTDTSLSSVSILSAGLRSRADFIREILKHARNLEITVVACYSEANPDKLDREQFGPTHFDVLTHRLEDRMASRLRIYQSHNTPSLRCILLSADNGPRYGFLSWYTYSQRNQHLKGSGNVQIFVDSTTNFGIALLGFADRMCRDAADPRHADVLWPPA